MSTLSFGELSSFMRASADVMTVIQDPGNLIIWPRYVANLNWL